MYDENVYKTIHGHSEIYPFPTNIQELGYNTTTCGVLIHDDLSPRIGFENCNKKLPYICEVNSTDKVENKTVKWSFGKKQFNKIIEQMMILSVTRLGLGS